MELTILEILYIVLIIFTSIIGTLLTIVLFRLMKVLGVAMEMVVIYNKIKQVLSIYSHIPEMIKEKVKEIINSKKSEKNEDKY